ncbi:hypothetical protein Esti_006526 [Eimeria stiedai]
MEKVTGSAALSAAAPATNASVAAAAAGAKLEPLRWFPGLSFRSLYPQLRWRLVRSAGTNSASAQASQLSSGVSRVAAARKRVSSKNNSASGSAPATARPRAHAAAANQGILKFYTEDAPGLRVGPQAVLIMALVFMGVVVMLHIVGKIRQSMGSS